MTEDEEVKAITSAMFGVRNTQAKMLVHPPQDKMVRKPAVAKHGDGHKKRGSRRASGRR